VIDTQFGNAFSYRFDVADLRRRQAADALQDYGAADFITKAENPFSKWLAFPRFAMP